YQTSSGALKQELFPPTVRVAIAGPTPRQAFCWKIGALALRCCVKSISLCRRRHASKHRKRSALAPAALAHQQRYHLIHRGLRFAARQVVVIAEDGKHQPPAAEGLGVAGERVHVAESPGLGMNQSNRGSLGETILQGTVRAAQGKGFFIRRTPGLSCRMDQQLHYGSGRDQVAPGKPGTVEKNELFLIEPGLQQKLLHRRRAALKGSSLASQFAGETQGKLRVKVLAGLINDAHIF